ETLEAARRVAEAQVDLMRVRKAQLNLLLSDMDSPSAKDLQREWDRALGSRLKELKALPDDISNFEAWLDLGDVALAGAPEPPKATVVEKYLSQEFAALNRYERRALSRRKFAIREFDAA